MAKRSKNYYNATQKIADDVLYSPLEAMHPAKETPTTKFDTIVKVVFRLGVDPCEADQMVRGTVNFPHGTDRTTRVLVSAVGPHARKAIDAGAGGVDSDELIEKAAGGYTDFNAAVATPNLMGRVGCLDRTLGPYSLAPNLETGAMTIDTVRAASDIKNGRIGFCVDEDGDLSFVVGKAPSTPEQLVEDYVMIQEKVLRLEPSTSKGRYLLEGTVATTMGSGIPLDTSKTRNLMSEDSS